jgi:hypothetical protein
MEEITGEWLQIKAGLANSISNVLDNMVWHKIKTPYRVQTPPFDKIDYRRNGVGWIVHPVSDTVFKITVGLMDRQEVVWEGDVTAKIPGKVAVDIADKMTRILMDRNAVWKIKELGVNFCDPSVIDHLLAN